MASDVKLSRAKLEAHYRVASRRSPFGDGREELDSDDLDALLAATAALLAVMEPARTEEIHESGGRGYRIPPGEIEEYRAGWRDAEARARRLANWQAEP
jgi:hypothetical protein